MKVLFTEELICYDGINSFIYTCIKEFAHLGISCSLYVKNKEQESSKDWILKFSQYCRIYFEEEIPKEKYNIIYHNSNKINPLLFNSKDNRFFVHGSTSKNLTPLETFLYNKVYFFSEKIFNWSKMSQLPNKELIRQPIDIDRFSYSPSSKQIKKILIVDSRNAYKYLYNFLEIGAKIEAYISYLGRGPLGLSNVKFDLENAIKEADLIVGYGRCIYEAMSCGKNVFIYGVNGGDGYLDLSKDSKLNYKKYLENNMSGWTNHKFNQIEEEMLDIKSAVEELKIYSPLNGKINRKMIIKYNNSKQICPTLLK